MSHDIRGSGISKLSETRPGIKSCEECCADGRWTHRRKWLQEEGDWGCSSSCMLSKTDGCKRDAINTLPTASYFLIRWLAAGPNLLSTGLSKSPITWIKFTRLGGTTTDDCNTASDLGAQCLLIWKAMSNDPLYKEGTKFWGQIQSSKDSANPVWWWSVAYQQKPQFRNWGISLQLMPT